MARRYRIKQNFSAGELSPLVYGRTDVNSYVNGCQELKNAYIKPQGAAMRRSGTQFIADMTTLCGFAIDSYKLVDFVFDETQAYVIIFLSSAVDTDTGYRENKIFFACYDADEDVYGLIEDPDNAGTPYSLDGEDYSDSTTLDYAAEDIDYAQSKDVLFIATGTEYPMQLSRTDHAEWYLSRVVFTTVPDKWSADDGYPKHVSFFESRLVYAATKEYPQFVWFSETGTYFTMAPGTSGTDPIEVQIKSEKHNQIQWLASGQKLFLGTIGDEWMIAGEDNTFSIETLYARRHSTKGSEAIRPVMADDITMFVERIGRSLMEFVYDYNTASYQSLDRIILSSHLTETASFTRVAYQSVPNNIIWCIKSDGLIAAMTYNKEASIIGWTSHDTDGYFRDVCCIPDENDRETNTWFLIEREINGETLMYLERLTKEFISQDAEDAWMVDSALEYDVEGTAITTVTGLDHLEGKEVHILAKGAVHEAKTVEGGSITLNYAVDRLIVGLPYTTRIVPLMPDTGYTEGPSLGRMQRITDINIYLYRSLGMWIGRTDDAMEEVPFRVPTDLTGTAVPLFSGIKHISFPEGYDRLPSVIIEQRQPLPLMVVSLIDNAEVYE